MKLVLLLTTSFMWILVLYYFTATVHMFVPIFGKWTDWRKCMIPFYGWIQWFKGPQFFN